MSEEERKQILKDMMEQYEEDFKDGDNFKVEQKIDEERMQKDYERFEKWAAKVREEYEDMEEEEKKEMSGNRTSSNAFTRSYESGTKQKEEPKTTSDYYREKYSAIGTGSFKEEPKSAKRGFSNYYESIYEKKEEKKPASKTAVIAELDKKFDEEEDKYLSEQIKMKLNKLTNNFLNKVEDPDCDWDILDLQYEAEKKNRRKKRYCRSEKWKERIKEVEDMSQKIDDIIFKCELINSLKINPYTVE